MRGLNFALVSILGAMPLGCQTIESSRDRSWPGLAFAANCGDGTCNGRAGEDTLTCPADCQDAEFASYNLQTICDSEAKFIAPKTEAEALAAVQEALEAKLRVRAVGRLHTSNGQLCGDGLVVSTSKLDQALRIERFHGVETVVTEAGIRYGDLTAWLEERGRSLGFAVLGTRDPSIAGAIATGSQGSSWRHNAVVSNIVEELTVIGADGELHTYDRYTADPLIWKALTASLGLGGIVTRVRLRVEPAFNLDVEVSVLSDADIGEGAGPVDYVRDCDYGQLNWFPGQGKVLKTCGIKTELSAESGATNRLLEPDFSKWIKGPAERALQYGICKPEFNCRTLEAYRLRRLASDSPFAVQAHPEAPLVGKTHVVGAGSRMMSSEFTKLQTGMLQYDFEFAVPASRAAEVFAEAKRTFEEQGLCFPLVGIFVRFSPVGDEAWIAHTSASPEFGVRPHWGKNAAWVFDLQDPTRAYAARWEAFQRGVETLDPAGTFSNPWLEARGFRPGTVKEAEE